MTRTIVDRLWVCECCMLSHANGQCCEEHDANGGESFVTAVHPDAWFYSGRTVTTPAVWALLPTDADIAMGGEHADDCANGPDGTRDVDCDCERWEFSKSACDGCGSAMHGTRHAFTSFA